MQLKKSLGVIPARFASTRFPGKPLIDLVGKTMIHRVCERARQSKLLDKVVVATDHQGIFEHVRGIGFEAVMTSPNHQTGTDRCAEVAELFPAYQLVVNIQGDEPLIDPDQIDQLVLRLRQTDAPIATLIRPINDPQELHNPNVVKALLRGGQAHYFSRLALPYQRGVSPELWLQNTEYFKHIGLYGFDASALKELTNLSKGHWEQAESLEQLRWLEAGYPIAVIMTDKENVSVDTEDDAEYVRSLLRNT